MHTYDGEASLSTYYPLPMEVRPLALPCLSSMIHVDEKRIMDRVIRTLHCAGYKTLYDLMNMTYTELQEVRGFGPTCEDLLLDVFNRIQDGLETFKTKNKPEMIKIKMRERGYIV